MTIPFWPEKKYLKLQYKIIFYKLLIHFFFITYLILKKQMIELCRTEGQKLLFEGRYDRVVPAALESLKFSIEVYGLSSIELVPSYLILGEASIGQYRSVYRSV